MPHQSGWPRSGLYPYGVSGRPELELRVRGYCRAFEMMVESLDPLADEDSGLALGLEYEA